MPMTPQSKYGAQSELSPLCKSSLAGLSHKAVLGVSGHTTHSAG